MNLMRIKYFVEVAKWNSFSKAAQMLYVSQPNLSRQVALMEQEVGFELFHRTGKSIQLTRAGEYLYEQLKDISEKAELAITNAEAISRRESCSLSIGVLEGQDTGKLLSNHIEELRLQNPRVSIEVERNNFRALRQGLDRGIYDVLLTMEFELEGQEDWDSLILFHEPGAVVLSRNHPLAGRDDLTLADFREEPFVVISREVSPGGYNLLLKQCGTAGFVPRIVRETSNLESLFLCIEMGLGVALLDRNTRLEHSDNMKIVSMPGSHSSGLTLAWKRENSNPMVRTLVENMRREVNCVI